MRDNGGNDSSVNATQLGEHLAHFIRHSFACDSEDGDEAVGSA
jgi:hypothetical protein